MMMCRVVGGAKTIYGQVDFLQVRFLADIFELGSGVTTRGRAPFFFNVITQIV